MDDTSSSAQLGCYHRLCLRYPFGQLGIDAEVIVAKSLACASWNGALWTAPGPPLLSLSLPAGDRDLQVRLSKAHVSNGAISLIVDTAGRELCDDGRIKLLKTHAGRVFKEYPDVLGGHLIFWTIDSTTQAVKVYRIHVRTTAADDCVHRF
jgi:hypothetical protein